MIPRFRHEIAKRSLQWLSQISWLSRLPNARRTIAKLHVTLSTSRLVAVLLCRPTSNVVSERMEENLRPDFRNCLCLSSSVIGAATRPFQRASDMRSQTFCRGGTTCRGHDRPTTREGEQRWTPLSSPTPQSPSLPPWTKMQYLHASVPERRTSQKLGGVTRLWRCSQALQSFPAGCLHLRIVGSD
jgi:hypothetical protein